VSWSAAFVSAFPIQPDIQRGCRSAPPPDHSVDVLGSIGGAVVHDFGQHRFRKLARGDAGQGAMPASLRVSVNLSGLQPGTYEGTITVTAPNAAPSALSVAVKLIVASGQPARLSVEIQNLSFSFARARDRRPRNCVSATAAAERWSSPSPHPSPPAASG